MDFLYTVTFGLLVRIIDKLLMLGGDPAGYLITTLNGLAAVMLVKSIGES